MYIVACCKCGEIKVISSITNKNGITGAYWCCPVCGAGQSVEIAESGTVRCGSLGDIVAGIGFASRENWNGMPMPLKKSFPSIDD
ncbi:MAG: alcohol dehydrogenase [Synergistaceae bacterium]|nr:alcohol dehydrogenase [Synergistaceae bacterium]